MNFPEKREEIQEPAKPGRIIEGNGIFLGGVWKPKYQDGTSVFRKYFVYAAPEDLEVCSCSKDLLDFHGTVRELSYRKNWHGRDGGFYKNDRALYDALKNGSYKGEWFIPPKELLDGKDTFGRERGVGNLYALRNTGSFKSAFESGWYLSCSERLGLSDSVWIVRFPDGVASWAYKNRAPSFCRPCCAELVPG